MNVVMLTHFYPPEPCAASNRAAAAAAALGAAGHRVRVLTGFPSFPQGRIYDGYRGKAFARESIDGIEVVRLWTYVARKNGARGRTLNWLSGAASSTAALCVLRKVDALYVSSPPITLAIPALFGAATRRCRLITDIRDAFPEVAVRMGVWPEHGLAARVAGALSEHLYRRSGAIACVTQEVRDQVLAHGVPPQKALLAPNGFDAVAPETARAVHREPGDFAIGFAGNMGLAAGVGVILNAAAALRDRPEIRFVLAGAGAEYEQLRRRAAAERLTSVEFTGALPRARALAVLRDCDVAAVTLLRGLHDSLPTKIFDAYSVERPVLLSGNGAAAAFVDASGGGWHVQPEDGAALAQAIVQLAGDRAGCVAAGKRGRAFLDDSGCSRAAGIRSLVEAFS